MKDDVVQCCELRPRKGKTIYKIIHGYEIPEKIVQIDLKKRMPPRGKADSAMFAKASSSLSSFSIKRNKKKGEIRPLLW